MKKLLGQTDSIKVFESVDDKGIKTREVVMKISDNTTITGSYVDKFVDAEDYKRKKQILKQNSKY